MIASGSPRLEFRIAIAAMIAAVTSTIRTMIGTMSCRPPSPAVDCAARIEDAVPA